MTSAKLLKSAKKILAVLLVFLFSVSIPQAAFASSDKFINELYEEYSDAETPFDEEDDGSFFPDEFDGFAENPFKIAVSVFLGIFYSIFDPDFSVLESIFTAIYDFFTGIFNGDSEAANIHA